MKFDVVNEIRLVSLWSWDKNAFIYYFRSVTALMKTKPNLKTDPFFFWSKSFTDDTWFLTCKLKFINQLAQVQTFIVELLNTAGDPWGTCSMHWRFPGCSRCFQLKAPKTKTALMDQHSLPMTELLEPDQLHISIYEANTRSTRTRLSPCSTSSPHCWRNALYCWRNCWRKSFISFTAGLIPVYVIWLHIESISLDTWLNILFFSYHMSKYLCQFVIKGHTVLEFQDITDH